MPLAPEIYAFGDNVHLVGETGLTVEGAGLGFTGELWMYGGPNRTGAADQLIIGGPVTDTTLSNVSIPGTPNNVPGQVYLVYEREDLAYSLDYPFNLALTNTYVLTAESGAFTITGTDADLIAENRLVAESGAFTWAGQDAALIFSSTLIAESGAFTWTGTDATLLWSGSNYVLAADSGTFTWTGTDAILDWSGANIILDAESGAYTWIGTDADLLVAKPLSAESGSYDIVGTDANLIYTNILQADSGSFTIIGTDADLIFSPLLQAASGTFVIDGTDADLIWSATFIDDYRAEMITLQDYFNTQWAGTTPISWQNVFVDVSSYTEFVRFNILPIESNQISMGSDRNVYRSIGLIEVQIFTGRNEGMLRGFQLADKVVDIFDYIPINYIRSTYPSVTDVGLNQGWYQVNVSCEYSRDSFRAA